MQGFISLPHWYFKQHEQAPVLQCWIAGFGVNTALVYHYQLYSVKRDKNLTDLTEGTPTPHKPSTWPGPFNPIEGFMFAHLNSLTQSAENKKKDCLFCICSTSPGRI